jgi:hypothetical protein
MPIVMGLDQHRAQISAEWIDTMTGELSRARDVAGSSRAHVLSDLAYLVRVGSRPHPRVPIRSRPWI